MVALKNMALSFAAFLSLQLAPPQFHWHLQLALGKDTGRAPILMFYVKA
jgi:hypothetical protein